MEDSNVKSLAEELLKSLSKQRSKGEFCDVQLTNGVSILWAHSCVLAAVSPFIMRYFVQNPVDWSVRKPVQINISTLTKSKGQSRSNCIECVGDIIDYIYTGKIKLNDKHINHVLNLSNNLEIDHLLKICSKYQKDFNQTVSDKSEDLTVSTPDTDEEGYYCETCCYKSEDGEQFLMHDLIFHRVDFTCLYCNFEDSSLLNILEHCETQCWDNTICSICLIDVGQSSNLRKHLIDHKNVKPFSCEKCATRFPSRTEWLNHFSIECKGFKTIAQDNSCPICKLTFPNEVISKKHIKVFHKNKYSCLSCEYSTYKIDKIISHLKSSNHVELSCSVCLYESSSKSELCDHFDDHLDKLPFKCKNCNVSYPNRRQWWRHMSSHHDEKPFSCAHCQIRFKNKVLLNTHELRLHKKKRYVCSVCGLAAPFPSLLEKHQKIHKTQKQEYVCTFPECDFKSIYKNHFVKHKKDHHSSRPEEKKTLQCSICKIFFSLEKNLNRHMRFQHNSQARQFKCPNCNYFTVRLDKIKDHCVKVHCMDEIESSKVIKLLKTNVPKKVEEKVDKEPNVVQLRIEENGHVIVKDNNYKENKTILNSRENQEFNQLRVDGNGNVVIQHLIQNRRHLQVGEDGSIILQENRKDFIEEDKNYSQMEIEEIKENVIQELSNGQENNDFMFNIDDNQEKMEVTKENFDNSLNYNMEQNQDFVNESMKKTLFLNHSTGEINIMSTTQGKPIPIANVTATNLLTIGNFREGTGSVTLNESTGVLTFNNINSDSTGAVFLNESTGELSYIDLNREKSDETKQEEKERIQLDEVTGEIIKVDNKPQDDNIEDIFDFDMENFNEDSFDGFDDFDELLFDKVGMENYTGDDEIQRPRYIMPGSQTPRLDEMTGELTFDDSSTQDIWNELKPFRDDVENDSILDDVNGSYNFFLNEITGEFYKGAAIHV